MKPSAIETVVSNAGEVLDLVSPVTSPKTLPTALHCIATRNMVMSLFIVEWHLLDSILVIFVRFVFPPPQK